MAHLFEDDFDNVWRYDRFMTIVQQHAGISWEKAERATRATLQTLAERIPWGEARDIAADLPDEIGAWLLEGGRHDAEPFDAVEFVRRVADREGVDPETAEQHARAVLVALVRLVRGDAIEQMLAQLPKEFAPLLGDAKQSAAEPMPSDVFLERVAGRAGLDEDGAARADAAVLETLAERIAGGEADDLAEQLPADLRPAIERGKQASGGKARKLSLDEFVERVAEREGTSREDALDHARAVFATLREAISAKELSDLLDELPRRYQEVLL
jgi:uncharacterized protein (DUF2267 family)